MFKTSFLLVYLNTNREIEEIGENIYRDFRKIANSLVWRAGRKGVGEDTI